MDKYLMEISLHDLETTSGEYQAYWLHWLIAVKARAMPSYHVTRRLKQHLDAVKQSRIELLVYVCTLVQMH